MDSETGKINSIKNTARIVGVLYIIGTVAGILSVVITGPILNTPDYLAKIPANESQVIMGALFILIMGLALAMVPVLTYPVLKKFNETLALGYVVFRGGLETFTYFAVVISILLLLPLGRAFIQAGAPDQSDFQAMGTLLQGAKAISANLTEIVFPLGALMFYYVLYRSRLIPRWISGWGLIAVALFIAEALLNLFGVITPDSIIQTLLVLPMAVQEMVMAIWLIVKGFDPSAIASISAGADHDKVAMAVNLAK